MPGSSGSTSHTHDLPGHDAVPRSPVIRRTGVPALRRFLSARLRLGVRRSSRSFVPALQMTICAICAYSFAEFVLGHAGPLFAATSSLIALGFSRDARIRRVLEVSLGCTLGIVMGELVLFGFGPGIWQAAVVLFASIMLARFLDSGGIFATQLGLQSVLVIFLAPPAAGPYSRSIDAVVGGCFALLVTLLTPRDPRREPQTEVRRLLSTLSDVLRECAASLETGDSTKAWHALVLARGSQPMVDALRGTLRSSGEVATISPVYRRYRGEIGSLEKSVEHIDYALRNSRVFARRLTSAINNAALSDAGMEGLAEVLSETASAVDLLGLGLAERDQSASTISVHDARSELSQAASSLHPRLLHVERLEGVALIMILRPLMVDILEAARMPHEEAKGLLPTL
ncbi:FUSC family protein [Psychromicrobium xiongbiense]|uniref:FUSC family protein n=1 Tax=Psychromicrobium xiongbiense TaxID=3051184 RepID=UPI0025550E04|nr:FUSC family protein [Psychromicrobium sp. YIM S02556]